MNNVWFCCGATADAEALPALWSPCQQKSSLATVWNALSGSLPRGVDQP